MRALELSRGSVEEAELLEATAATHGAWVHQAAPLMERVWLMRSAWAPGLRYVGGLACHGVGARTPPLPVGGAGQRLEDALAGCLAEAVERTAQIERSEDVVMSAPIGKVRVPDRIGELIALIAAHGRARASASIDWMRARHLGTGEEAMVPADWCLRRSEANALALPGGALSTGCAAAATFGEAAARGLLELVERDAAALWWLGGKAATSLRPASAEAAAAARIAGELGLGSEAGRVIRVLDITCDLATPVFAAFSHRQGGTGLAIGLGAHLSAARAVSGALLELSQMELGLQLATDKRDQLGETALTDDDRRHLARASFDVAALAPLATQREPRLHPPPPASQSADPMTAILARCGVEAWAVELTRPGQGLAVAKVIAPFLQPMPGDIVTARLAAMGEQTRPPISLM